MVGNHRVLQLGGLHLVLPNFTIGIHSLFARQHPIEAPKGSSAKRHAKHNYHVGTLILLRVDSKITTTERNDFAQQTNCSARNYEH
jgi:hypothetical protein